MRLRSTLVAACFLLGCGARTDLPEEDLDGNVGEDAQGQDSSTDDVEEIDATVDAPEDTTIIDTGVDAPDDVTIIDAGIDAVVDAGEDADAEPPECTTACNTNHECESTCPTLPKGRWCCDKPTDTCYAWAGKHCPVIIPDAGFD
jgi:hypothetical protein